MKSDPMLLDIRPRPVVPGEMKQSMVARVRVYGLPRPGGSKTWIPTRRGDKSLVIKSLSYRGGRVYGWPVGRMIDDAKGNAKWKRQVAEQTREVYCGPAYVGPLKLGMKFFLPRPANHFRTGRNAHLRSPNWQPWPTKRTDTTKYVRSTEDALKGILWDDDSQIVAQEASKHYADGVEPGVLIVVWRLIEVARLDGSVGPNSGALPDQETEPGV